MIQPARYQKGHLYEDHGAWFVRYRLGVRQPDGSLKPQRLAERLGGVEDFATKAEVEAERTAFMQRVNSSQATPHPSMTLTEFLTQVYLPWVESERRASTQKGYREIWSRYLAGRIGTVRLRQFRTVDASKALREIAEQYDLTKSTLGHIKSVLSGIFTHAKNEGAFDGQNPVRDARLPGNAREPGETYAYNLLQILHILELLPLLPKAVVVAASFAGLREGELRGLEWPDWAGDALTVNRSVGKTVVNEPKTRASRQSVPVIPALAKMLAQYRASMHYPRAGVMFHHGNRERMDLDKLPARDPSSRRGQRLALVRMARVPTRHCLQRVRVGCQ